MGNLALSIERAAALLGSPKDYGQCVSIKILQDGGGCCCMRCWPDLWDEIIRRYGLERPDRNEGDFPIRTDDGAYVLQCHETGPEVILYLGLATASVLFAKSVVELVLFILRSRERRDGRLKVTVRRMREDGAGQEEDVIEVERMVPDEIARELQKRIGRYLDMKQEK